MERFCRTNVHSDSLLVTVVLFSALALRKVVGLDPRLVMFPLHADWWKNLLYGCLLAAAMMALLFVVEVTAGWLVVEGWNWQETSMNAWLRKLWLAMLVNVLVAVAEETMFRGYLLTGLDKAWGKWIGLIATAILFSLPHLTVMGAQETNWLLFTVLLALPGLLLGWTFLQSRSLWLPVGIHFAWNLMQDDVFNLLGRDVPSLIGAVTRQQGPEYFVGTSYGIEVGLAGIAGVVLVWLGVWFWTRKDQRPQEAK